MEQCNEYSICFKVMKDELIQILKEIGYPLLCFNDADQQNWEDDPNTYITDQTDSLDFLSTPRGA